MSGLDLHAGVQAEKRVGQGLGEPVAQVGEIDKAQPMSGAIQIGWQAVNFAEQRCGSHAVLLGIVGDQANHVPGHACGFPDQRGNFGQCHRTSVIHIGGHDDYVTQEGLILRGAARDHAGWRGYGRAQTGRQSSCRLERVRAGGAKGRVARVPGRRRPGG